MDPSRTTKIQNRFASQLQARLNKLRGNVLYFLVVQDALDLKGEKGLFTNVSPREFRFNTNPQKLESFNAWFAEQVEAGVFTVPFGTPRDRPWFAEYVDSAYKRGQVNAYLAARHAELLKDGVEDSGELIQFLAGLAAPESVQKVRMLYVRVFEELKGVTNDMSLQMSRILSQGLIDGSNPLKIARDMSAQIRSISRKRALLIARTEIIQVHAEGQLDAFKNLGVTKLGVRAEWSTAGDDRVCPKCAQNEGKIFKVSEASGLIPLHPNCRCIWIPYIGLLKKR